MLYLLDYRKVFIVTVVLLLFGGLLWLWSSGTFEEDEKNISSDPIEETAISESVPESLGTEKTIGTTNTKGNWEETRSMLERFGSEWLNYRSIYDRNQSVKPMLTQRAIDMYAIDVDPNVELVAEGTVTNIFKSDELTYLITGEEHLRGNFYKVFIEIELSDDGKIDDFFEEKVLHDGTEDDGGRT